MALSRSSLSHTDRRSLSDWLTWQESLHPAEIDLGLERVKTVYDRLRLKPPPGRVFTVAGTNGKGSTVAAIDALLRANGLRTGAYTSPHLVRYNERIVVNGEAAPDAAIVAAFEQVDAARKDISLTYFEFGTLAALQHFSTLGCEAWVLEVGLGGRLDAVNVVDADVAVITTVDLDHQAWLGDSVEQIAAEKAGILRAGRPGFFGDTPVPTSVQSRAAELGVELRWRDNGYRYQRETGADQWHWQGSEHHLRGLAIPVGGKAQRANQAVALAAVEACNPRLLDVVTGQPALLTAHPLPGRVQCHADEHRWVLDVAHNPQAARVLHQQLADRQPATVVIGMLADKAVAEFVRALGVTRAQWLTCPTEGSRGATSTELARQLAPLIEGECMACESVEAALERARSSTPPEGLILVCGSFGVVGPALRWLGLY
jgi:dihydrofolate synthase/folylpolyglutamate synthase